MNTRSIIICATCFLVGALIATVVRTSLHKPYAEPAVLAPATPPAPALPPAPAPTVNNKPVNTVCAICGMPVDPAIPTATYQGKAIGFGCKACPPKFSAHPEKYGPAALANRVVEE